jgi:hypothetical protein
MIIITTKVVINWVAALILAALFAGTFTPEVRKVFDKCQYYQCDFAPR